MALTSIIIPTHDRPHLLPRAIESARRAGTDIEIVVVDDGSTDETSTVCSNLPDIVYVRLERRRGVGYARSAGIAASSGAYIAFLDDDDARLPGSIDRQLAVLESTPDAALVYGQVYLATQRFEIDVKRVRPRSCPTGDVFWQLMVTNFMPSCSVVFRRKAVESVGGLFHDVAPADDWDLWLRVTERFPIAALPEPVSIYREPTLWSKQGSSRLVGGLLEADMRVMDRCAKLPRAIADPQSFKSARLHVESVICLRLIAEAFQAAVRSDPYAFASLRHASARTAALRVVLSPRTWKKFWSRIRS